MSATSRMAERCGAMSRQGNTCAREPGHIGCHEVYVEGDGRRWWGDTRALLGATMVSARSKSGRRWEVHSFSATWDEYHLYPLGGDVVRAQVGGKFNGGVRSIRVPYERLHDPQFWRVVP